MGRLGGRPCLLGPSCDGAFALRTTAGRPLHKRLVPLSPAKRLCRAFEGKPVCDPGIAAGSSPLAAPPTPACPPFQTSGTSPHGADEGKARDGFGGQEEGQKISPRCPRLGPRFAGSEERFAAREPIDPVDQLERRTPRAQSERPARNPAAIRHLHHMAQAVPPQFRAIRQGVRALVRVGANMKIRFKRIVTGVCNSEMAVSAVGYDH